MSYECSCVEGCVQMQQCVEVGMWVSDYVIRAWVSLVLWMIT